MNQNIGGHNYNVEGIFSFNKILIYFFFLYQIFLQHHMSKFQAGCFAVFQTFFKNLFNSLPSNKFLDLSKLKALADDKINVTKKKKMKFVLRRTENIVGKGEITGYQHFLLFLQKAFLNHYQNKFQFSVTSFCQIFLQHHMSKFQAGCFAVFQTFFKNLFNSLPSNKFLDLSKLKALADDKINVTKKKK